MRFISPRAYPRLRSNGILFFTILLSASCTAASCQSGQLSSTHAAAAVGQAGTPTLADHFTLRPDLVFRDTLVSSTDLQVYADPRGGFVVADGGESQVRVYSQDAQLAWAAGRRGDGPREFQQLSSALRGPSGEIFALDINGRLSVFDPSGNLVRTVPTRLNPAFDAVLLTGSSLLISGRREGDSSSPLLHVWDLAGDSITRSFFGVPPHDPAYDEAYRLSGWADAATLGGDSIVVVFPMVDTLYLYRSSGELLDKFHLPLEHFMRLRTPHPRDASTEARVEWRNSYTRISHVFRAPDGSIYVQYFRLNRVEPVWGLARFFLDRNGLHKSFEIPGTPRLVAISPRDSLYYFLSDDVDDLMENSKWSVAQLSR